VNVRVAWRTRRAEAEPDRRPRTERFGPALAALALEAARGPDQPDNFDPSRHPDGSPPGLPAAAAGPAVAALISDPELEWLFGALEDEASRDAMLRLFAFRLLGAAKRSASPSPADGLWRTSYATPSPYVAPKGPWTCGSWAGRATATSLPRRLRDRSRRPRAEHRRAVAGAVPLSRPRGGRRAGRRLGDRRWGLLG
jgi:hypothetical protein